MKHQNRHSTLRLLLVSLGFMLLTACMQPPSLDHRSVSTAVPAAQTRDTTLGKALLPLINANPGKAGIYMLGDPHDAFAARALLANSAEKTLDVQYYIWRHDMTGTLLFEALHAAADRGVRVRLLLDDNNTSDLDTVLAALDAHPSIEVRLFNPFLVRSPRLLGFITDFSRANRRMHNKSFTADNQATIIGGRNIGDEYFGATPDVLFADLDVMAIGPVVEDVSRDFDLYWASDSSYPASLILPPVPSAALNALATSALSVEQDPAAAAYTKALHDSLSVQSLTDGSLEVEWARTQLISDDPAKGLGLATGDELLTYELARIVGKPDTRVGLVSPYFVPTAIGVQGFNALAESGVEISILTNALEATDVRAVHAGYAKRREALLKGGIKLYESRREYGVTSGGRKAGPFGSSASSLHAKTFSVDESKIFVGSFNFDPRSAQLNTESGFLIESPVLAARVDAAFAQSIPTNAYEVRLSEDNELYWLEQIEGNTIRHNTEPGTNFWQRAAVKFLGILPIEWLL